MALWTDPGQPRIWRVGQLYFRGDEPMQCPEVCTDEALARIAANNYNGIWLRGRLSELVDSTIFPELNDPQSPRRMDNLRLLVDRCGGHGLKLFVFFNEPLALPDDHPFWKEHPELRGEPWEYELHDRPQLSLCTSAPEVMQWFRGNVKTFMDGLPGLGGVILITASEYHTHCWSHHGRRPLSDGFVERAPEQLGCPRCREREPAEIVGELVGTWAEAARVQPEPPRVIAWNWSWSMWYEEPQREVIEQLPDDVALLVDYERGEPATRAGREVLLDEYSLGLVGPSKRFALSRDAARKRGLDVFAKLQMGTTHELATVPNLPLAEKLQRKLAGLAENEVAGIMGCWNFGCMPTLNTFMHRRVVDHPQEAGQPDFLVETAREYFGSVDTEAVLYGWRRFGEAFDEYPFSIPMLYWSPVNYAPAYPLVSHYAGRPIGPSWIEHTWGEDPQKCLSPYTLDEVVRAFGRVAETWDDGLARYRKALADTSGADDEQARHRRRELDCAEAIGCHLESTVLFFEFHRHRLEAMAQHDLTPPCDVPLSDEMVGIIHRQRDLAARALELVERDDRLGYHQEPQHAFYTPEILRESIERMQQEFDRADAK